MSAWKSSVNSIDPMKNVHFYLVVCMRLGVLILVTGEVHTVC